MNEVKLKGRISRDVKSLVATGDFVGFSLCTNEDITINGVETTKAYYHSIVAGGKLAIEAIKNFRVGVEVEIKGKLRTAKSKNDKYYTSVVMNYYKILSEPQKLETSNVPDDYFPSLEELHAPTPAVSSMDDDIPF